MTNGTTILEVTHARKRFGQVEALRDVTLGLRQGELLALLGPNGAGKTTLIRAISGRVRLDGGELRLFGRPLDDRARSDLGVVPQEIALYPLLTARENLSAFGRLYGLTGADLKARVDWTLDRTGLADRAAEPVKQYSGGMKRRLNIACGILHRPKVLLLDEPTAGVDPQSRERIYEMLDELRQGGVSLLLTTHHLEEAEARCERTIIIDHGQVIAAGTLQELVARTVGSHRLVTLRVDRPLVVSGMEADQDGRTLRSKVRDVAAELPALLRRVQETGAAVEDVEVRSPSLQSVFIHLTGRELRE